MSIRCIPWALGALLWILLLPSVHGQTPEGPEFQIDDFTAYSTVPVFTPALTPRAGGGFIAVWSSGASAGTDLFDDSIQGRLYGADGQPEGPPFQVNSYTTGDQRYPSVATTPNGDFIVVWGHQGVNINDPTRGIHAQRFDSVGTPQGNLIQLVGPHPAGPEVAATADGFLTIWHDDEIFGQRVDAAGMPVGSPFQINSYTTGSAIFPDIAVDPTGRFIVVWANEGSAGSDASLNSVQAQRLNSDGSFLGSEFQVNTYTSDNQWFPSVSTDAEGGFTVVWQSSGPAGNSMQSSILGQRYDSTGAPVGAEFQSSETTASGQSFPQVAVRPDSSFVVVWDASATVQGRTFDGDGEPEGPTFRASSVNAASQYSGRVAVADEGKFVVAWRANYYYYGAGSYEHLQGQRFRNTLFFDGFESGDLSGWSTAVP